MSNPWASSYDALRAPYLQEKKAKKDYDGDGKVESGSKEHAGVVHNAIQRAKGGKPDGKDTRKEETVREGMKQARKNVGADTCWDGYKAKGTKKKNGREVPNCVKEEEIDEGSLKQARKNVGADTCWDGYKAKGTKMKNGRSVPNCVKEEDIEVNHIDGSKTQIIDVVKAPRMPSAADIMEKKKGLWDNIHAKKKRMKAGSGEKKAKPGDEDYPKTLNVEAKKQYYNWREDFIWEGPATAKDPKLDVKETGVKNKIEVNPEVKTEEKKKSSSYSSTI